ncbi:MAG: phosphoribosylformylglycinamidine cyclo-ligase, partial [Candidatus Latescibacteria bacterium]|nr:phosphoribosylformylglycinamidine cyclo-ligase [Candidatus Latescibacterota bacterium]
AHCANDILVQGARPLFFLDYLAMGTHDPDVASAVIEGVATGCRACGCALLGGEMAEMPDFYTEGEYDLAGTIVGIVDRNQILTGSRVQPGDCLIGLASDGLHTNGYSLARKLCFETAGWSPDTHVDELDSTIGEALLAPHRNYVSPVMDLIQQVPIHGMVHITGGGLNDNLPRTLPKGAGANISRGSWPELPIFGLLQQIGDEIDAAEMFQVFNMGIGFVIIVPSDHSEEALEKLCDSGEKAYIIGDVVEDTNHAVHIT